MKIVTAPTLAGLRDSPLAPAMIQGGGATRKNPFEPADSSNDILGYATFGPGCRNNWHTHSCDQFLIITEGPGIMATHDGEQIVRAGDMVLVPADEEHYHAGTVDSVMTHIIVLEKGSTTIQLE